MTDTQSFTNNNITENIYIATISYIYYTYYLYIEIVTLSLYDTHIQQQQQYTMEYILGMPDVTQ